MSEVICRAGVYRVDVQAVVLGGGGGPQIWWDCVKEKKKKKKASSQCVPHCTDFTYSALPTELSCLPRLPYLKGTSQFLTTGGDEEEEEEEWEEEGGRRGSTFRTKLKGLDRKSVV